MYAFHNGGIILDRSQIKDGDIVAFDYDYGHGVALMKDGSEFYSAYNLFRADSVWVSDYIPEEIRLFAPNREDLLLAIDHLTSESYNNDCLIDHSLWQKPLHDADEDLLQSIDKLKQMVKEQIEIQEHIVKRWQKERDNEKAYAESQKIIFEDEAKEKTEKIEQLETRIQELEAETERLKKLPSEDSFVKRLVKEAQNLYKHEKQKTEVIRQILHTMGCNEAEAELDAWIEGKETKKTGQVASTTVNNYGNIFENGATQINNQNKEKDSSKV